MKSCWQIGAVLLGSCFAALLGERPSFATETESENFRAILEMAMIGPEQLAQMGNWPDCREEDWRLLLQVLSRFDQFRDPNPTAPYAAVSPAGQTRLGDIVRLGGRVVAVEKLTLPAKLSKLLKEKSVYACELRFLVSAGVESGGVTILTTRIPKAWLTKSDFQESVRVRGVLVQFSKANAQPILLANHLAWFPHQDAPTGHLLLARHGMDVALLDEVRHGQPFVKPEVSREGEAFYAALTALRSTDQAELLRLARGNVQRAATDWLALQPELKAKHLELVEKIASVTEPDVRMKLQQSMKQAKQQRGLAAAVVRQAESSLSSVAPMFLQPEREIGELYVFEGIARRAVRIAVADQSELDEYYELEVFTADSQNHPIVCCVSQLPANFPTGDEIREPVRVGGVFFKKWRYRSRKLADSTIQEAKNIGAEGEAVLQRQLYTPVVLAKMPNWLNKATERSSGWAFWAGATFLAGLMLLWICLAWLARRDRQARAALRSHQTIDL